METEGSPSLDQRDDSKELPNDPKQQKPTPKSLNMAKLGKNDLLRLLSILEGELEARDIYITTLQAHINRDSHVKGKYFNHSISDPFLALMRDNEAVSGSVTPTQETNQQRSEEIKIAPLPLLEKVVNKYKKQQEKVKKHLALSDAYYNMVNEELREEKRRGVSVAKKENASCEDIEMEQEKLRVMLQMEKSRTKRIELEYKKLLQLVSRERAKNQVIITMLLNERQNYTAKEEQSNNREPNADPKLHSQLNELMARNEELEQSLQKAHENEVRMTKQVQYLFQQAKIMKMDLDATDSKPRDAVEVRCEASHQSNSADKPYETPQTRHADDLHQTVAVKRSSSVIEKRIMTKSYAQQPFQHGSAIDTVVNEDRSVTSRKFMMLPTTTAIVSSPTSGAANFALNSPNQPQPSTPFPIETIPVSEQCAASHATQFQETRQKFQQIARTSSAPSPPVPAKKPGPLPSKKSAGNNTPKERTENHVLPSVAKNKSIPKRVEASIPQTGQLPKPPKGAPNDCNHVVEQATKIRPPPLPPKKPNLLPKQTSTKLLSAKAHPDGRKPGIQQSSDKGSRLAAPKVSAPKSTAHNHGTSKAAIARRPTSLNTNNSSNRNLSKRMSRSESNSSATPSIQPAPPGFGERLSAQQRLFPSQEGYDGQLRSPVTNTVPKSPIGPSMFTFK